MASFLATLEGDIENIAESDMPSAENVRGILGALVKRVEQLAGIDKTEAPVSPEPVAQEPPVMPEPTPPVVEPTPAPDTPAPDSPVVPPTFGTSEYSGFSTLPTASNASSSSASETKAEQIAALQAQIAALQDSPS